MEPVKIPISGLDTRVDNFSPSDGSCAWLDRFRPTGKEENPRWKPIPAPDQVTFDVTGGPISAFYAFDKWFVLNYTFFTTGDLYLETTSDAGGGTWETDVELFHLTGDEYNINTKAYWQKIGNVLYLLVTPGDTATSNQHQLWKITEDATDAIPLVIRPKLPTIQVTLNDQTDDLTDFEDLYPPSQRSTRVATGSRVTVIGGRADTRGGFVSNSPRGSTSETTQNLREPASPASGEIIEGGSYPGILKNKDKYIGIITAWKHPNGKWVKHSQPFILEIEAQTSDPNTTKEYTFLEFAPNSKYTDDTTNYNANTEHYDDYQFRSDVDFEDFLVEQGVFITVPKDTRDSAIIEGTYYFIGSLDEGSSLLWNDNEELIPTGEVLNTDPFSHHIISAKTISQYENNLALVQVVTNFVLPGWERENNVLADLGAGIVVQPKINEDVSGQTLQGETVQANEQCAIRVTIETEKGIFYRWNTINFIYIDVTTPDRHIVYFSGFQSYPDIRATQIDLYWYDSSSGEHYLFKTVPLKPHPFLNISFYGSPGTNDVVTITVSNISGNTEVLDFSDNEEMLVEETDIWISDISKLFFPLEWNYQLPGSVKGLIDNTREVGDGQFGEYPLYVLCENKIFGGQSGSGGVVIPNFDLISDKYGAVGFNSFDIHEGVLFFISETGFHALRGSKIENIYYGIQDILIHDILFGWTQLYPNITLESGLFDSIKSDNQAFVATSIRTDEIIFGRIGGGPGVLLIYNTRYNRWYTYSVYTYYSANGYDDSISEILKQDGKFYFIRETIAISYEEWGTNDGGVSGPGLSTVITNPIIINDYSIRKKIRTSVLQARMKVSATTDVSLELSGDFRYAIILQGRNSTHNDWLSLIGYWGGFPDEANIEDVVADLKTIYIKSNAGSFQEFRIIFMGRELDAETFIENFICAYDNKSRKLKA